EIGLLAEVGRPGVSIVPRPRVAVLSTGNELVAPELLPAAGQIRNSNGPMLLAAARSAGATPIDLGIGRDEVDALRRLIEQGLEHDVLLLSGGVSAGKLDLVPGVLQELGVREVFHKVSVKPGKPLWFGVSGASDPPDCLVFGLPGNPVSSLVGFELFVRPALAALAGHAWQPPPTITAELGQAFVTHGNRSTYYPARLDESGERPTVELLAWQGSGDLRTITEANCLAIFAPGETEYAAGANIPVMRI
ncbi:MAG: molybdopterin molybdotransferase MoeA, partial [Pirellulales bacterium]